MAKIEIIKYTDNYNILKIQRDNLFEYYIEKVHYGDLRYVLGSYEELSIFGNDYIDSIIELAEEEKFWGED